MKVVINKCFGGFSLSKEAVRRCGELGLSISERGYDNAYRSNPILVRVVEELGDKANGDFAKLRVIDIPFDGHRGWEIDEYDGMESVVETHRSWG